MFGSTLAIILVFYPFEVIVNTQCFKKFFAGLNGGSGFKGLATKLIFLSTKIVQSFCISTLKGVFVSVSSVLGSMNSGWSNRNSRITMLKQLPASSG